VRRGESGDGCIPASKRAVSFALADCAWAPPAIGTMTTVATRTIARKVLTGAEIMLQDSLCAATGLALTPPNILGIAYRPLNPANQAKL
jgi:hypothetical protein